MPQHKERIKEEREEGKEGGRQGEWGERKEGREGEEEGIGGGKRRRVEARGDKGRGGEGKIIL